MLTRTKFILFFSVLLSACGTFPLSGGVVKPDGKTADQQQNDVLFCQDQANQAANTNGQQAKAFLMGLTIVGTPIFIEQQKTLEREVFAKCMTAKSYIVKPVETKKTEIAQQTKSTSVSISNSKPDDVAKLEKIKDLRDRGLISSEEYDKKRKEVIDNL